MRPCDPNCKTKLYIVEQQHTAIYMVVTKLRTGVHSCRKYKSSGKLVSVHEYILALDTRVGSL